MVFTVPKPLDSGRNQVFPHLRRTGRPRHDAHQQAAHDLAEQEPDPLEPHGARHHVSRRRHRLSLQEHRLPHDGLSVRREPLEHEPLQPVLGQGRHAVRAPKSAPAFETGLAFFAKWFKSPAYDYVALKTELEAMPDYLRERTLAGGAGLLLPEQLDGEVGRQPSQRHVACRQMELGYLLKQTQQLVFGATVYAVWKNPDFDDYVRQPLLGNSSGSAFNPTGFSLKVPRAWT
jgi:hypothetical protein